MKRLWFCSIVCMSILFVYVVLPQHALAGSEPEYEVEDLSAMLDSEGVLIVNGKIRNTGNFPSRGHVIVYFTDENDSIIDKKEAEVNENGFIYPGKTGEFELSTSISKSKDVNSTYIEYIEKDRIAKISKPLLSRSKKK